MALDLDAVLLETARQQVGGEALLVAELGSLVDPVGGVDELVGHGVDEGDGLVLGGGGIQGVRHARMLPARRRPCPDRGVSPGCR